MSFFFFVPLRIERNREITWQFRSARRERKRARGEGGEIIFIENGIQNATPHIQCEEWRAARGGREGEGGGKGGVK